MLGASDWLGEAWGELQMDLYLAAAEVMPFCWGRIHLARLKASRFSLVPQRGAFCLMGSGCSGKALQLCSVVVRKIRAL